MTQTVLHFDDRARSTRRGFTLLEMLLVLSLLVVMTSFAWPLLSGPFARQRVARAADQIRTEWARCRNRAMLSGDVYMFRYLQGSGQFQIERYAGLDVADASGTGTVSGTAQVPLPASGGAQQEILPEGVTFLQDETLADVRSQFVATDELSTMTESWSAPILFYPDGTTSTTRITLVGDTGRGIAVSLRGLTGIATVSELFATEELTP